MTEIAVLAPVLGRPHNAAPLAESLASSTDRARLVFICSPSDHGQITACRATGAETLVTTWEPGRADWARKLELGRGHTDEPYLLLGADDIRFHQGWDDAVLDVFAEHDVGVVGTNDLANPRVRQGLHSTHPVVCRGYADQYGTVDDPATFLHQGYWHQFVDNELIDTARWRGCWLFCAAARVEHAHPIWRTAPDDDTYRRGSSHQRDDHSLYARRRRLWR